MLAYIFFVITTLFYIGLTIFTYPRPSLSGEAAMGYGLGLAFFGLGFTISSLLLTIAILVKGGVNWLSANSGSVIVIFLLAWLFVVLTTSFCAVFKWEWHTDTTYPQFLRWLAVWGGHVWIPLLWLVICFFSLKTGWQLTFPLTLLKIPFWVVLGICMVYSCGLLVGYLRDSEKTKAAEVASMIKQQDHLHKENLTKIAAHTPKAPLFDLLIFTNRYQDEDVRQAALAKIKAYPDWEAQLLDLLKDKQRYHNVYYFLDGNKVAHPQQFAEPVNQNIEWLATYIQNSIKNSNNLQHWSYDMYNIERILKAIDDQFINQGVDFYPNVVKLKQALHTTPPERFKGVRFTVTAVVEDWLKKHKK